MVQQNQGHPWPTHLEGGKAQIYWWVMYRFVERRDKQVVDRWVEYQGITETYSMSKKWHCLISYGWEPYRWDSVQQEPILRKT